MPILMIGETERERIAKLVAFAKAHPVSLDQIKQAAAPDRGDHVMRVTDRKPGTERPPSDHVVFPGNYRAAFSIEVGPRARTAAIMMFSVAPTEGESSQIRAPRRLAAWAST